MTGPAKGPAMALPEGDRQATSAELGRLFSARGLLCAGLTKADLKAAVDAVDGWLDTVATSYNNAIPQPARAALSNDQKALLLSYVARKRAADLG